MIKKIIIVAWLAIWAGAAKAQDITRKTADSLVKSLSGTAIDTNRVKALMDLAQYQVSKPGEFKADMDSALQYLRQAQKAAASISEKQYTSAITLIAAQIYREKGDVVTGKKIAEQAIVLLQKENNQKLLGKAYMELANHYSITGKQLTEKIKVVQKAQSAYERAKALKLYGDVSNFLGELYLNQSNYAKALPELDRSLKAYKKINHPYLHPVYVLYGSLYYSLRDLDRSLYYQLLALKSAEKANDHSMLYCEINNHIALTYLLLKDPQKAIPYLNKAIETATAFHDITTIYVVTLNKAMAYRRLKQSAIAIKLIDELEKKYPKPNDALTRYQIAGIWIGIYTDLKVTDKAIPYIKELHAVLNLHELAPNFVRNAYLLFASYYTATKQYNTALKYIKESLALTQKVSDNYDLAKVYDCWFKLDTTRNDYRSAVARLLHYNQLNDTLYSENKSRQIEQLRIAYETSQKEDHIKILQAQDKLHQHELAQSVQYRKFYAIGLILLILLLGLGYSRYRIKQRNNAQLLLTQKEISGKNMALERLLKDNEWLLKEVHHRVKNNLQIVMSLLASQSVFLQDREALNAVMESQHRVQAMSLIHQKLYKNNNISNIYMPDYINDMLDYLKDSYLTEGRIHFDRRVAPIYLDVSQAVPLGLILNEAVTNAIKYAFPQVSQNVITVEVYETAAQEIGLIITDNGIGFPESLTTNKTNSFGLSLMRGLVDDLEGVFKISSLKGTSVRVSFKKITISTDSYKFIHGVA